jgi:putative acyl-CoA dehydrogenase
MSAAATQRAVPESSNAARGLQVAVPAAANQAPPLANYNLYAADRALQEALAWTNAGWAHDDLSKLGGLAGEPRTIELGFLANRHTPQLHTHDRYGNRRDEVEFHPAYHELMTLGCTQGLHSGPWAEPRSGAHAARAAAYLLYGQVDSGTQCPLTMTYAATAVLVRHATEMPALASTWLPRVQTRTYDANFAPIEVKRGATLGMGMTEKQGGSDVRANVTVAEPLGHAGSGQPYRISGHKWFMSAPMCDAFLILAQAAGGLSCFFLPRFVDGRANGIALLRLKDKLGNRSNASTEAEFEDAIAWLIGAEGRGVKTIIEMVNYTRLDCGLGSAAMMRQALAQAAHHARHRAAFGRRLDEHALMQNVLADLALESEAATSLSLWLASLYDAQDDAHAGALRRLLTPAVKYWLCKRAAAFCEEAMEVLGGNGYVEDSILPRLYREAPVNSIWEGSGNIMCLDLLRALRHEPAAAEAVAREVATARGADARLDRAAGEVLAQLRAAQPAEAEARRLAERLVLVMQGSLLVRHAPAAVADAFCASRLGRDQGGCYGALPAGIDFRSIVSRAWPT